MRNLIFEAIHLEQQYSNSLFGLRDVSLSIQEGEIVGLIGKNGSGKTTLLNVLANLEQKKSGECHYQGSLLDENFYKKNLGFLPTNLNLYDYLTLKENLEFVFEMRGKPYDEIWVKEMLAVFELSTALDRQLVDLSKGMRIKFNFITTLIHQPDILLLDELFEGVDPAQAIVLKNVLKKQASIGKGILLSSHILSYIADICHRAYYIEDGKIIKEVKNLSSQSLSELEDLFHE